MVLELSEIVIFPSLGPVFFPIQNLIIMQITHVSKQYTKVNTRTPLQLGLPAVLVADRPFWSTKTFH